MLNKYFRSGLLYFCILLCGCTPNFHNYLIGDPVFATPKAVALIRPVYLEKVQMPNGDKQITHCRFYNFIKFNNDLSYSAYLETMLRQTLYMTDSLTTNEKSPKLQVIIKSIDLNSLGGSWKINAQLKLNDNQITNISYKKEFTTSIASTQACQNAANAFDEFMRELVDIIIYNKQLNAQILKLNPDSNKY